MVDTNLLRGIANGMEDQGFGAAANDVYHAADEIERLQTWINVIRAISTEDKYNQNPNIVGLCLNAITGEEPPEWWVKHLRGDPDNPPPLPIDPQLATK